MPQRRPAHRRRRPRHCDCRSRIEIRAASVDELRLGAGDDAFALRALRGRIHLGDERGALHRFAALQASHDRGTASGDATIKADPPFAIEARLAAASAASAPAWQANASATGPLAELQVAATARVEAAPPHGAQSLDAKAMLRPFAAWPLGELQAAAQSLDLAAFAAGLPSTSLSGRATVTSSGLDRPALVAVDLRNARAGRWNEGLLPVESLRAEMRARPDDPGTVELQAFSAELGAARLGGGQVAGAGRWSADRWQLDLALDKLRPAALDARAPETVLDGKLAAVGTGFAGATFEAARVELRADLAGQLVDRRLPKQAPQSARLRLEAHVGASLIDAAPAEASLGGARATLAGRLTRAAANAPWHAAGRTTLADFDPAPWWPGEANSLLTRGTNRLNLKGEFDLDLPRATDAPAFKLLAATRGKATLALAESQLAGVPLLGEASYANSDGNARAKVDLVATGNRLLVEGRFAPTRPTTRGS
jgi:translocation and assembly module TamB